MLAQNILPDKKRTLAALVSFYALPPVCVVTVVLLALVALLGIWVVLIDALAQLCAAIAQVWAEAGAVEHLVILVLAWAIVSQVARLYRRVHDARI